MACGLFETGAACENLDSECSGAFSAFWHADKTASHISALSIALDTSRCIFDSKSMHRASAEDGMLSSGSDLACSRLVVIRIFFSRYFMIREKLRSLGQEINPIFCAFSARAKNIAHLRITGLQVAAML